MLSRRMDCAATVCVLTRPVGGSPGDPFEGGITVKMRVVLPVVAALGLIFGVAAAIAGGGNSNAAELCQDDGWQQLTRTDGSTFRNTGDCVSYAARGGILVAKSESQRDCEAAGGTFSRDVSTDRVGPFAFEVFFWSCNGAALSSAQIEALDSDCEADFFGLPIGHGVVQVSGNYLTCLGFKE